MSNLGKPTAPTPPSGRLFHACPSHRFAGAPRGFARAASLPLSSGALAIAVVCSVFVIADLLYGATWGIVTAAAAAAMFGWFWYGLPLSRPG